MVEEKLLDYVRNAFQKGFSIEDITKLLKRYSYSQRDIDEALWVVSREMRDHEEKKEEIKQKKSDKKKKPEKLLEMPSLPSFEQIPEMSEQAKLQKFEPIPEIEFKAQEKIEQKFFPEKGKKKHILVIILEIIGGILLFAAVGVLMYMYLWPVLLNVR
ncbi:hypothetical protein COV19_02730 [Candidatus Woesearchaeota archaeon CG10_big_fil_rev_8_21_14_0_10_44_13]|nr:MAG: hypothetical protein COV19_02730 [Candidatus Woesearchaeota archaeon CG10_big_fil_rev_8_21_14_0_10_44_13]